MKKFGLISLLALVLTMMSTPCVSAQTRKGSASKKTAVSVKKTSGTNKKNGASTSKATTLPINGDELKGTRYIGLFSDNEAADCGLFSIIDMSQYSSNINLGNIQKISTSHTLKGNKLEGYRSPAQIHKCDYVSSDGGKTFKGELYNSNTRETVKGSFIRVSAKPMPVIESSEELLSIITGGGYNAFFVPKDDDGCEVGYAADMSFNKGNENSWIIKPSDKFLDGVSCLEGNFTIEGNKIKGVAADGGEYTGELFDKGSFGNIKLGMKTLPNGKDYDVYIIFVKK